MTGAGGISKIAIKLLGRTCFFLRDTNHILLFLVFSIPPPLSGCLGIVPPKADGGSLGRGSEGAELQSVHPKNVSC